MLPDSSTMGWERLFWFVFNSSAHPMALIDELRRVVEVNDALLELLQRSRIEVLGASSFELIPPSERAAAEKDLAAIMRTESGEHHGSGTLTRPDRSQVEVAFAARSARVSGRRYAIMAMLPATDDLPFSQPADPPNGSLTDRERQVVSLIAMGRETPAIAEELHISPETVRTHVRNAMAKFDVHTRAELVAVALSKKGLLHLPHLDEQ